MIFDAIAKFLVAIFKGVLGLLPDLTVQWTGIGASLGSAVATANGVFPVETLGMCILAVLGFRFFLTGIALVAWVWDKIPFTFK